MGRRPQTTEMAASSAEGVLPIDKPVGPTSHDMVARARRALGIRRVGHTGTLDPFASGLLLLCLGRSTRLAEYLTGLPKTYAATLRLGVATDTDDRLGAEIAVTDAWRELEPAAIEAALHARRGRQLQLPPDYSARKVGGERAYRLARAGTTPALEPSEIDVYALDVTRIAPPEVDFTVRCSAGTYIRSIARDVGERLETGGYLAALRRTEAAGLSAQDAIRPEELEALAADGRLADAVRPVGDLLPLPRVELAGDAAWRFTHGSSQPLDAGASGRAAVFHADRLLGIGTIRDGMLQPEKVLPGAVAG